MRIALIDVDGHRFPSLPLMKVSAWHKEKGDTVVWYEPLEAWVNRPDRVYMSKVFSFTEDYAAPVYSKEIVRGGTGYYPGDGGDPLPEEVEHIYPDYSLYPELTTDTAFGFLTRGCPRACDFCIVSEKEGRKSQKVADLSEFWRGQKKIKLLDPNLFACSEWRDLSVQLIDSRAYIDFTQGCDIRLMTEEMAEYIRRMRVKQIHFAWDRYADKEKIIPKFEMFRDITGWKYWKMTVYVLTNYDTTVEQDLERIYTLRDIGFPPYVMVYNKEKLPKGHTLRKIQRWVNSRKTFRVCSRFEDYVAM